MQDAAYNYKLKYEFATEKGDDAGKKGTHTSVPDDFVVTTVTTERPFIVNGTPQGTFTLDGDTNIVIIKFNETVNNLSKGEFVLDISTNNAFLKANPDTPLNVGGRSIPIVKHEIDTGNLPPAAKSGEVYEDEPFNDGHHILWTISINPAARGDLTEPMVIEDSMPGIYGKLLQWMG